MSISTNTATPAQTRLYISPLSPSLLPTVLPPSLQHSAVNISCHTLDTFPANKYGYLELPTEDAQKLRKKFNGVFLRGMKVRVEEARPDKKRKTRNDELESAAGSKEEVREVEQRAQKKAKKEKRKDGVLPAIELPQGREVKRGWAQPAASSKEEKRKGKSGREEKKVKSEKSEMLFRTVLPPNVVSKTSTKKGEKKERSEKEGKERKKGKGTRGKEVEVKEFSKSTKYPTFLRNSQVSKDGSQASEYVDGVGWVDGDGKVVENPVSTRSTRRKVKASEPETLEPPAEVESSSSEDEQAEEPDDEPEGEQDVTEAQAPQKAISPELDTARGATEITPHATSQSSTIQSTKASKTTTSDLPATENTTPTPNPPREVHPLEALFKRPPPSSTSTSTPGANSKPAPIRPAPIVTSFSFFGSENDEGHVDEEAVELHPPQTPFTQRDLQHRGQRSAAPTPDTAAVGKKMGVPWLRVDGEGDDGEDDEEDEEEADDKDADLADADRAVADDEGDLSGRNPDIGIATADVDTAATPAPQAQQSDFEKHFWEHRGEYNRGWKARKREARKGVRQSENRRGGGGSVGVGKKS